MALIKCDECGKEISNKANICPNCGISLKTGGLNKNKIIKIFSDIFITLLLLLFLWFTLSDCYEMINENIYLEFYNVAYLIYNFVLPMFFISLWLYKLTNKLALKWLSLFFLVIGIVCYSSYFLSYYSNDENIAEKVQFLFKYLIEIFVPSIVSFNLIASNKSIKKESGE